MTLFDGFPAYDRFRTLHLTGPPMRGEDVYALQTALDAIGFDTGGTDGVLGQRTAQAIVDAQAKLRLSAVDGLAGGDTQKALALHIATGVRTRHDLPSGLLHGQMEHESSLRLGMYSPERPDNSYDAGVTQRNTAHTPASDGFHVPDSIEALGALVREFYDLFAGVAGVRRWQLAMGAWNAPAFACWIANEEGAHVPRSRCAKPSTDARALLEAYMAAVSVYLKGTQ